MQNGLIYVTVFEKTNRLARKSIIAYARNSRLMKTLTEREAHLTRRLSVGLASHSEVASSLDVKGNTAKKKFVFLTKPVGFPKYGHILTDRFVVCRIL